MAERMTLEKHGYRVIIAPTGERAVEIAAAEPDLDLILMDIDLGPGMSGTDAAKLILADRDLPLAFLSSHTEPEIVRKTEGITSYGYIVKNSGETVLIASIHMAFRLHAEKRARMQAEARNRAMLDANPDVMLLFDERATIIDYHAGDPAQLLVAPKSFLNRQIRDVVAEDLAQLTEDSIAQVLESGAFVSAEYQATHSGEQRHYESRFVRCGAQNVLMISRDITERKRHEERIRLLSEMLDAAPNSILVHDLDGRFLYANQKACEINGYPYHELMTMNLRDLKDPESASVVEKRMKMIGERGCAVFEAENRKRDGTVFPVEVYAKLVTWGETPAVLSIADDISERRKAESQLRLQALVLDQIQDMVTVTDLDGTVTYVNQAYERLLGFEESDLVGQPVSVYGEDERRGATQEEILSETREKGWWRGQVVNVGKDGSAHILDCRTQVVRDDGGTPVALCGISTDITEITRMYEALRKSEQRYRAIFEHLPVGLCYYDSNGVCLECNQAMAQIVGVERSALIGFDLKSQEDQAALSIVQRALRGEEVQFEGEIRLGAYPEPRWIKSHQVPLTGPDGEIHVIGIVEDYTERHLLEQQLRRSQERLQILSANILDTVSIVDPDGTLLYVTESHRQLGYAPEDLVGSSVFSLLHPEDLEDAKRAFAEGANGRGTITKAYRVRRADGRYVLIASRVQVVFDEDGTPRYGVISGRMTP